MRHVRILARALRAGRVVGAQVADGGAPALFVVLLAAAALFLNFSSSALAAEEHGYIAGKVTAAATGAPIAGVKVCAINLNGRGPWGCTTTDAQGKYIASVFEDGSYYVHFTAPSASGYIERSYYNNKYSESEQETVVATVGQTTPDVDAELPEGGQILGTVTNAETHAPVAEVEVCGGPVACVLTNAQGEYAISGLPGGEYQVSFGFGYGGNLGEKYVAPEYYKNDVFPTFKDEPTKVQVPTGGVAAGIDQEMQEYSRMSGRVVNSVTKAPVAGIWVEAYTGYTGQSSQTNANGEYIITHLADASQEYSVSFTVPNNSGINYFSQYYGGPSATAWEHPVKLALGREASKIDAELVEGGQITGKVTDATTKGPPVGVINVCAHLIVGAEGYQCAGVNANGEYDIDLLHTGEYTVEFNSWEADYIHQYYDGKATVAAATPVVVTQSHITTGINAELEPKPPSPPLDLTWAGALSGRSTWSSAQNWAGKVAPDNKAAVGTLSFPEVSSCSGDCYESENDLEGLTVESLRIDDGESYKISGRPFTLERGLSASPATATSAATLATVSNPIDIGSTQGWSIAGSGLEHIGENALLLRGELSGDGGGQLYIAMSEGGALYFDANNQIGVVNFEGSNASQPGIFNGVVGLFDKQLNSANRNPVNLNHVFFIGAGSTGPLRSVGSELAVTTDGPEGGTLTADGVELDAQSALELEITGSGPNAGVDWSDLYSSGTAELGGASLGVRVAPPAAGEPCPTLLPNETYVLVSASGALSGSFGNAPAGSEIPIKFAEACKAVAEKMRIEYHRTGATKTVTGTVIGGQKSSTALSVFPLDPVTNEVVTLVATVGGGSVAPSGTVEFKDGADAIPNCVQVPVTGSVIATCKTVFAASESPVRLSALYSPDPGVNLQGSASPTEDLQVGTSPTTTTLRASGATITTGDGVTLTASVHPVSGGGPSWPSGSVEFLDDGTPISACESQPLSAGGLEATCHLIHTVAGTHGITAKYSGDDNFAGSSSSAQTVAVMGLAAPLTTPITTTTGTTTTTNSAPGTTVVESGPNDVTLTNTSIVAHSDGDATVELACAGPGTCSGRLTLTATSTGSGKAGRVARAKHRKTAARRLKTIVIGAGTFSIPAGKSAIVTLALNAAGRALLKADHGRLKASLAIVESSAGQTSTRRDSVRLVSRSRG